MSPPSKVKEMASRFAAREVAMATPCSFDEKTKAAMKHDRRARIAAKQLASKYNMTSRALALHKPRAQDQESTRPLAVHRSKGVSKEPSEAKVSPSLSAASKQKNRQHSRNSSASSSSTAIKPEARSSNHSRPKSQLSATHPQRRSVRKSSKRSSSKREVVSKERKTSCTTTSSRRKSRRSSRAPLAQVDTPTSKSTLKSNGDSKDAAESTKVPSRSSNSVHIHETIDVMEPVDLVRTFSISLSLSIRSLVSSASDNHDDDDDEVVSLSDVVRLSSKRTRGMSNAPLPCVGPEVTIISVEQDAKSDMSLISCAKRREERDALFEIRDVLQRVYHVYDPSKCADIDTVLKHFEGRHGDLVKMLSATYDITFDEQGRSWTRNGATPGSPCDGGRQGNNAGEQTEVRRESAMSDAFSQVYVSAISPQSTLRKLPKPDDKAAIETVANNQTESVDDIVIAEALLETTQPNELDVATSTTPEPEPLQSSGEQVRHVPRTTINKQDTSLESASKHTPQQMEHTDVDGLPARVTVRALTRERVARALSGVRIASRRQSRKLVGNSNKSNAKISVIAKGPIVVTGVIEKQSRSCLM
jgi:hypothetical protein